MFQTFGGKAPRFVRYLPCVRKGMRRLVMGEMQQTNNAARRAASVYNNGVFVGKHRYC